MVKLIVAGREVESASSFPVENPFDGSVIAEVASADSAQVEEALAAAEAARAAVRDLSRARRGEVLQGVSRIILARQEDLALTLASEVGKTLKEARGEVARAAATFAFAADEARRLAGEVIPFDAAPGGIGRRGYSLRVPLGVVLAITPFNFPLNLAAHKIAPAMAAGNPFILKPASVTPLTDITLGRIVIEAGFPPEAVSVLPGPGASVGMALVADERPRMVTFTGSVEVGKEIARHAGFKRIAMELGSNSAAIVTESADLDFALKRICLGGMAVAGQVCISVQRVIAHDEVFDRVVDGLTRLAGEMKMGDQLDEVTDMGPMITEKEARRVEAWVGEARDQGAAITIGGARQGAFFEPTIIREVPRTAALWREEAFGPVICVNRYGTFDEAIDAANDSRYGLQAGVFTQSVEEAFDAAERIDVGGVIINDVPTYRVDQMPYGGVKDSGIGREGLKYAIDEMTEQKLVCFNFWKPR